MPQRARRSPHAWWVACAAAISAACGAGPTEPVLGVIYDACSAPEVSLQAGVSDAQRAGVASGAALWSDTGAAPLQLGEQAPAIAVRFEDAIDAFHGVYDPRTGAVAINRRLEGEALAITVAHELGHAMGLGHVDAGERLSLMNPGNVSRGPTEGDVAALRALWGDCLGP